MGLTTGHVFSDGDTVTAAKLNSMVNDATISADTITSAMIQDDAIDSRHIADGAITSNHITSGSVALDSIASGQTTEGYLIQTDASGDLTTLNAGAAGLALISNGAEAAPSYSAVSSSGIHPSMISGHIEDYSPDADDLILFKDKSLVVNRCAQLQNVYKTVSKLPEMTGSIAGTDEFLIMDGGNPKRISHADLEASLVTAVEETVPTNTFYQIDEIYVTGGNLRTNGIAARPFMSSTVSGTLTPTTSGIADSVYQPFELSYSGIGTEMPHAGEIVKIQATQNSWGSSHFGGAVEVIRIDPNGTRTNNSILVSHAIPSGVSNDTTSTTFTSGNSFTAGTVLGVRLYGTNINPTPFLRVLITYKFTV